MLAEEKQKTFFASLNYQNQCQNPESKISTRVGTSRDSYSPQLRSDSVWNRKPVEETHEHRSTLSAEFETSQSAQNARIKSEPVIEGRSSPDIGC